MYLGPNIQKLDLYSQLKMDYQVLAKNYENEFFRDMESLYVLPPAIKNTGHRIHTSHYQLHTKNN